VVAGHGEVVWSGVWGNCRLSTKYTMEVLKKDWGSGRFCSFKNNGDVSFTLDDLDDQSRSATSEAHLETPMKHLQSQSLRNNHETSSKRLSDGRSQRVCSTLHTLL